MADGLVRVGSVAKAGAAGATPAYTLDTFGNLVTTDFVLDLLRRGLIYVSGDADENDTITGRTSYAATTPDLLLRVPEGTTAMPLGLHLAQTGTVAGGVVEVYVSFDRIDRWSSGGTSETITHMRTDRIGGGSNCTMYSSTSAITAAAASDARLLWSQFLDQDVTDPNTTEAVHIQAFRDFIPPILVGPAAFLVFTSGATTGVTLTWSVVFAAWSSSASSQT